ncbi:hypothetical protein ALC60_09792, partial [Trachymyrmex zeteki]
VRRTGVSGVFTNSANSCRIHLIICPARSPVSDMIGRETISMVLHGTRTTRYSTNTYSEIKIPTSMTSMVLKLT